MISPEEHSQHIHPLIPSQLPEFVRVDHPTMVAFLSAYYEWLDTQTDYLRSPMKLGSVVDVDKTLDQFLGQFKNEYLLNFPKTLAIDKTTNKPVDERKLIKNIKAFYAAKGTEKTYEFLFRVLYDTNVEFYYPKRDILKLSDGKWIAKRSIKTSAIQGNFVFQAAGKNIVQRDDSGNVLASARVIDVTTYQVGTNSVAEFSLSGINGQFVAGNYGIEFTDASGNKRKELRVFSVVTEVSITNAGANYKVGDSVVFTPSAGDTGLNASGTVQEVDSVTGAVKKIRIDNFGVNYNTAPTVTIESFDGSGFAATTSVGALAQYAGYYANNDSRLSTNKVLQDNHYYQNFSYVLLTEVTIDRYRDVLRELLHPAGMGFFGSVLLKRCNYENIDKTASLIRYEVPLIGNYAPYTNNTYQDLSKWFVSASGDVQGFVPRVHGDALKALYGNPIGLWNYYKDQTEGGITGWGYLPSSTIPIGRITSKKHKKISVGYHSVLALSATGTVSNSTYEPSTSYGNWVNGLTNVSDIGAGLYYSGAVLGDGSLTAGGTVWYARTRSPVVLEFLTSNTPPPGGTGFKSVHLGPVGAIGLKTDGTPVYWGVTSGSYQVGKNLLIKTMDLTASPWYEAKGPSGGTATVSLSSVTGPYHLAGFSTGLGLTAYQIDYVTGLTSAAGQTDSFLRTKYYAFWGIPNNEGKPVNIKTDAGISGYLSSVYVRAAPGSSGAVIGLRGVAAGTYTKLTLNEEWQRLTSTNQKSYTPRPTSGNTTVFELGIGNDITNGTTACSVYVWGPQLEGPTSGATATNYVRVEDHGVTSNTSSLADGWRVCNLPTGVTFDSVSLGEGCAIHAVGLMADGGITAWGYNDYNQCNVPSDKQYKQVSAGRICTLALTKDGGITGWGSNSYSQLNVPTGKNFVSVNAGYHAACAIDVDGNSWFWGRSYQGTLSNPYYLSSPEFVIPGATGITFTEPPYIYNVVSPSVYPAGKWKFKQLGIGAHVSAGLFDAQELRSSGLGLSAAEPFWLVYQHPNQKIRDKVIARIPLGLKQEFLASYNTIPTQDFTKTTGVAGDRYYSSNITLTPGFTAPDGTLSAYGLANISTGAAGTNQKYLLYLIPQAKRVPGKIWTWSCYVKQADPAAGGSGADEVLFYNNNFTPGLKYKFSTNTLTPLYNYTNSNGPTLVTATVTPETDGWKRLRVTARTNKSGDVFNGYDYGAANLEGGLSMYLEWGKTSYGDRLPGDGSINLYTWGWQLEEGSSLTDFNPIGTVGDNYWQEWAAGNTAARDAWAASFTGNAGYAVLQYIPEQTEFRKITARSFFNMPIGAEFNCKYAIADSIPKPYLQLSTLNGKAPPYDLSFVNGSSQVTGGSSLNVVGILKNLDSIPYYGIQYMVADLYWVSVDNSTVKLLQRRDRLAPTVSTFSLTSPFSGVVGEGMFTNYPGNSGWVNFSDGTQLQANGKYRLVIYYTDVSGKKITGTETSTEFIYGYQ